MQKKNYSSFWIQVETNHRPVRARVNLKNENIH